MGMSEPLKHGLTLPPEHKQIGDKCPYPTTSTARLPSEEAETSVCGRFETIVRLHPDRLAVQSGAQALSYEDLNRAANRIARAIFEKRGSGSEPIALLFEPGVDISAAILGVLKTGKFFVALDPAFPEQ